MVNSFNPACTLAMVLTHTIPMVRGWLLLLAQIVGGIFASFLVSVIFPTAPNLRTTLSDGTSLVRGVFIEAILTAELVFTILMMAKEKHRVSQALHNTISLYHTDTISRALSLLLWRLVGPISRTAERTTSQLTLFRTRSLRRRASRSLLHRRFAEPSTKLWPLRHRRRI